MTLRRILTASLIGCVALSLGCRHRCHKLRRDECSVPAPMLGGSPAPRGGGTLLPPTNITPQANFGPPPTSANFGPAPTRQPEILLPSTPPSTSKASPRSSNVIIYPPTGVEPLPQPQPRPESPETAKAQPRGPSTAPAAELFPAPPAASTSPLPTGIADYARVKDNVYSGLKPSLDGLAWLKKNNFKAVLRLRKPTDTDEADRALVEQQGLKFLSLPVAPESIDRTLIDQFNEAVNNPDQRPILVYDKDGSAAGAMWYLHFRTSELLKDDEAQLRARKHGLRETGSDEQVALWLAVQKFLSEKE